MESQPQNPEFRINPENFHPWVHNRVDLKPEVSLNIEFLARTNT